jgi:hypothetical protein
MEYHTICAALVLIEGTAIVHFIRVFKTVISSASTSSVLDFRSNGLDINWRSIW